MKALTQAKRDQARQRARASIHRRNGPAPTLDQFKKHAVGHYPSRVKTAVYLLVSIPLLAFLSLSAMRLYDIGKQMHEDSGNTMLLWILPQSQISGADVVIGAEFAQIAFVIALSVLAEDRKVAKMAFVVGIILSTLIALVGNVQAGLWHEHFTVFRLLITLTPPVIVLVLGEVLALLWLDTLSTSHEAQRLHKIALTEWSILDRDPEQHPDWPKVFATALRDALCQINNMTVDDLPPEEWMKLVEAELHAEDWYSAAMQPELQAHKVNDTPEPGLSSTERAVQFLRANAEVFNELQSQRRSQIDVAHELGVSQSAVSRAMKAVKQNGYHATNGNGHSANGQGGEG